MPDARNKKNDESRVMLGFIVRRCAADIGHAPTPDEFARWANSQRHGGKRFCLFGKEISAAAARAMFGQPGRLVTIRPEGLTRMWKRGRSK